MTTEVTAKKTPVLVIRGWKPSFLSQQVDWIEGTFKDRRPHELPSILSQKSAPCKPVNGYLEGSRFEDGRVEFTHPGRPEMGKHITWSGAACAALPLEPAELIQTLGEQFFTFTRIDLAIDAHNFNLRPEQATKEIDGGRIKTRARKFPFRGDAGAAGYTQYVGKRPSEIHLRIYDKAAEMGVDEDHTRIELETRGARAGQAAREIVRGTDFRRMVVSFADFTEWGEWRSIMEVDPVKLPYQPKASNTRIWLFKQCAPAIARLCHLGGGLALLSEFNRHVEELYRQLSNYGQTVH